MDKREQIILSAIKLFSTRGFQATSTTSITQHAGVGTGTLFLYFKSKDEMINTIYLEVKAEIANEIGMGIMNQTSFRGKLKLIWINMVRWALQNHEKFLFVEHFSHSPFINNITKEEAIGGFKFIFDLIREGVKNEVFGEYNDEYVFTLLNSHINGTISYILANGNDVEKMIDQSFTVLWKGLSS
jgi:TetR/AcrR family transcriptional regulator, repressor of fatR-cypB operon